MSIMTVRTTIGRENIVIGEIEDRVKTGDYDIQAVLHPDKLKGYVIVEGETSDIRDVIDGLRHVSGLIEKPVEMDQIEHFLEAQKGPSIDLNRGDKVEIIGGPFKREKGKVTQVDESDEEVTVELLEAAVPIPVTISIDSVRILEKSKDVIEEAEEEE